jgi:hypothetical protein
MDPGKGHLRSATLAVESARAGRLRFGHGHLHRRLPADR